MDNIRLLYIDLFCGAGGTSTGVEKANYKERKCAKVCIRVAPLFRRIGIEIKKSTRYNLIEASEEGFYKIEGLKTK